MITYLLIIWLYSFGLNTDKFLSKKSSNYFKFNLLTKHFKNSNQKMYGLYGCGLGLAYAAPAYAAYGCGARYLW